MCLYFDYKFVKEKIDINYFMKIDRELKPRHGLCIIIEY